MICGCAEKLLDQCNPTSSVQVQAVLAAMRVYKKDLALLPEEPAPSTLRQSVPHSE